MSDLQSTSSELVTVVARLVRQIRRHNSHDLPAAATRLMSLVDELGPSTVGRLAESDRCSQPTMTGLVHKLVERGWAERSPHPDDSRASLVDLTPLGRKTLAEVRHENAELLAERLTASGHSQQELASAVALLKDLLNTPAPSTTDKGHA